LALQITIEGATPTRKQIRSKVASALRAEENRVAIKKIKQEYGEKIITVFANIYDDEKALTAVEQAHYAKRLEGKKAAQQAA